jgi:transcription termination factor Rho
MVVLPAIDVIASGTRKEELLLDPVEAPYIWKLRRVLHSLERGPAVELLIDRLKQTKSNREFLAAISKNVVASAKRNNGD